jgi:4-hydroxy-tetrahydrodipicolinate synthase
MNNIFNRGEVYTVIVTPFDNDGNIIFSDFDKMINYQIKNNISGIILLGTTSESPTIDEIEQKDIVNYIWNNFNNKIKIIIGIGGNNTKKVIEFGKFCVDKCDGFMVTVPNYNKPTQDGIFEHFFRIANEETLINKEMMLYNIPSRCGVNMEPETIINLCSVCKNITAIKEASGSLNQIRKISENCDIKIYSGDDLNILPIMSLGGVGVISVGSNIIPSEICKIVSLCNDNNYNMAREIFYNLSSMLENLFIVSNPIPIKYVLCNNKLISYDNLRLPLVKLRDTNSNNIIIDKLNKIKVKNLQIENSFN